MKGSHKTKKAPLKVREHSERLRPKTKLTFYSPADILSHFAGFIKPKTIFPEKFSRKLHSCMQFFANFQGIVRGISF